MGALAADLELDAMKDAAEAQIVAANNVIGRYAPLVAAFCRNGCAVDLDVVDPRPEPPL